MLQALLLDLPSFDFQQPLDQLQTLLPEVARLQKNIDNSSKLHKHDSSSLVAFKLCPCDSCLITAPTFSPASRHWKVLRVSQALIERRLLLAAVCRSPSVSVPQGVPQGVSQQVPHGSSLGPHPLKDNERHESIPSALIVMARSSMAAKPPQGARQLKPVPQLPRNATSYMVESGGEIPCALMPLICW